MSWYVAKSLNTLLDQLNALAPHRSKASDGSIGDASHSSRLSDHNPTSAGQVCARDFTHDPAGGLDGNWLAATLVASRDPRIKYVIWNRRIIDSRAGQHPWQWMPYTGTNPHDHHVHVSVFAGAVGDNAAAWNLGKTEQKDWLDMATPQEIEGAVENGVFAALVRYLSSNEVRFNGSNWADLVAQIRNSIVDLQTKGEASNEELADLGGKLDELNGNIRALVEALTPAKP